MDDLEIWNNIHFDRIDVFLISLLMLMFLFVREYYYFDLPVSPA